MVVVVGVQVDEGGVVEVGVGVEGCLIDVIGVGLICVDGVLIDEV